MIFNSIKYILYSKINDEYFRNIEREIDSYVNNHDIFKNKLPHSLFYLLVSHEIIRRGKNISAFKGNQNSQTIKNGSSFNSQALETALYMAFNKCADEEIKISRDIYKGVYDRYSSNLEDPNAWLLFLNYSMFEYCCIMKSRKYFDVFFKKGEIHFVYKNQDIFRFITYGYKNIKILNSRRAFLRSTIEFTREKDSYIRDIDKTIHYWLYRTKFIPSNYRIPYYYIYNLALQSTGKVKALRKISNNWNFGHYCLEDFIKLWIYLDIKCSLHLYYFDPVLSNTYGYPFFYLQTRSDWEEELSEGAKISIEKARAILSDLIFDPNKRNIGVRIQPFVPYGINYLALSPTLVCVSLIEGNLLELQSKTNKKVYDAISGEKEKMQLDDFEKCLQRRNNLIYKRNIKIRQNDRVITDIDLAIVEIKTKTLILIQMKWLLRPRYIYDIYKKNEEIEKAIEQAEKSYKYVEDNIEEFIQKHFKNNSKKEIKNILSIIVARDNIGANINIKRKYPVVEYEIIKMYLENIDLNIKEIYRRLLKYRWLPKYKVDYRIRLPRINIAEYRIVLPALELINNKEINESEEFNKYIENMEFQVGYSFPTNSAKRYSTKRIAEAIIYFQAGVICYKNRELDKAADNFKESINKYPMWEAYSNLGSVYVELGEYEKAEKYLSDALLLKDDHPDTYLNLGILYCMMGDKTDNIIIRKTLYNRALDSITKVRRYKIFDYYYLYLMGYIYDCLGNPIRAKYYYEKSIKINPDYYEPYPKLMVIYISCGLLNKNLWAMEQIERLKPDFPSIQYLLSGLYVRLRIFNEKSREITIKALALKNNDSEEIYIYLLQILAALGLPYQEEYTIRLKEFIDKYPKSENIELVEKELERNENQDQHI